MTSLRIGDVVWVEFPHVETNRVRSRPALIVSMPTLGPARSLAWALMITNAERSAWQGDVPIVDHEALGLPIPSKIRTEKIATLDVSGAHLLGHLSEAEFDRARQAMQSYLATQ